MGACGEINGVVLTHYDVMAGFCSSLPIDKSLPLARANFRENTSSSLYSGAALFPSVLPATGKGMETIPSVRLASAMSPYHTPFKFEGAQNGPADRMFLSVLTVGIGAAAGFTLVELLAVISIIATLAALASVSFTASTRKNALDSFANNIRQALYKAHIRSINSRSLYLVEVTPNSVQFCEIPNVSTTTCNGAAGDVSPLHKTKEAVAVKWAKGVDLGMGPAATSLPALLYFLPSGAMDSDATSAFSYEGATLYLTDRSNQSQFMRRKITVIPATGLPKITDTW